MHNLASEPVVEIVALNHAFGHGALQKAVLSDITLSLFPGEIVILMGPSGSGKTTLLTLMGGLRSAQDGSLKVLGQELRGAKKPQLVQLRNQIGFIFQSHHLLKCLSAQQNVRMPLKLHRELSLHDRAVRAHMMLKSVGLEEFVDVKPDYLSGGQQQRVAIARALVSHPKLVLADEPTAALDSQSGRDVVNIMQKLAREQGCTILLVTHDNRILDVADRILQMEDGRLKMS
jgi:putative ABC transport system ATP-binding protein